MAIHIVVQTMSDSTTETGFIHTRICGKAYAQSDGICHRYKYELSGEALGLGVSGGVTALCLTLLTSAVTGGAAAQNTGQSCLPQVDSNIHGLSSASQ